MAKKFDDEDDELGAVLTASKQTSAQETKVTTPAAASVANASDDVDLIADAEDLKAKGILGSVLPKEPNVVTRFALVPGLKAKIAATHFLPTANGGKGSTVICLGQDCPECGRGSDHTSRRKIAALAVKYTTDNNGKFPQGTTVPVLTIGYVSLSPSAFTEMSAAPSEDENETIYTIDFRAVKKTNGIGWTFSRAGKCAYAKTGLDAQVKDLAEPYLDGKVLKSRLGKVVSAGELKVMLFGDTSASLADLEGID